MNNNKYSKSQDRYWNIVIESLIKLFNMSPEISKKKAFSLKSELDSLSSSKYPLYYHEEPIYIAASLAGLERDISSPKEYDDLIKNLQNKYQEILEKL